MKTSTMNKDYSKGKQSIGQCQKTMSYRKENVIMSNYIYCTFSERTSLIWLLYTQDKMFSTKVVTQQKSNDKKQN